MNIRDSPHNHKWRYIQRPNPSVSPLKKSLSQKALTKIEQPPEESNLAYIHEMLPLPFTHILILPLPPQHIHHPCSNSHNQTDRPCPPNYRCSDQIILQLRISPSAHPQTQMKEWPIKWSRSKDIFFIRVWNECVVGRHHCYVEMPKVAKER